MIIKVSATAGFK